jgi:hypothetical protein
MNRFRVILLCLAAATTFWFLNAMNKQHTATLNYPVEFLYNKEQYVEVEELPTEVVINVNGLGWNLLRNNLGIKTSPLLIPLENPSEIKQLSAITIPSLISDQISEYQLNYVLTDTLYINLDERDSRTFYLRVDSLSLPVREGFRISSPIRIAPDSVIFFGPKRYLASLPDSVYLPLNEDRIDGTFNENISVPTPEKVTSVSPPIVQVGFNVDEFTDEEIMVPLKLVRTQAGVRDTLTSNYRVRVEFTVQKDRSEQLQVNDFTIIGNLDNMGEDSLVIPRLSYYPLGLINLRFDSSAVEIQPNNE